MNTLIRNPEKVPVLLDGGLSTELKRCGWQIKSQPYWTSAALWDADVKLQRAHCNFVQAGAQILLTATYQLYGKQVVCGNQCYRVEDLYKKAVHIARRAGGSLVGLSLGPCAAFWPDESEYRPYKTRVGLAQKISIAQQQRLDLSEECGADFLAFETLSSMIEIEQILKALSDDRKKRKAWISVTLGEQGRLLDGSSLKDLASLLIPAHPAVFAVGLNCLAPALVLSIWSDDTNNHLRELFNHYMSVVYPNAGGCYEQGRWEPSRTFCSLMEWATWYFNNDNEHMMPIDIMGGCCEVGAAEINQLMQLMLEKHGQDSIVAMMERGRHHIQNILTCPST